RINVLSEIPEAWHAEVRRWSRINAPLKQNGAPDANEELLIYQTLVGAGEIEAERLTSFLEKAAREAKTHSSWLAPNEEYENALKEFGTAILAHGPFLERFRRFHKRIAVHGMLNALAQVVVKTCSPGVPDFYQGTELWDFSLVDPDNRRPVDYEERASSLRALPPPATLLRNWRDGRVKLFVTSRSLAARARFADAPYVAIETTTPSAFAFQRGENALIVVPRLTTRVTKAPSLPLGDAWQEHAVNVNGSWRNVFTGEVVEGESLPLREVFATFPVAIFERVS
ncbi:MAG TPA: malto-oligosyltrehalose synthase, partial [Thermoanaerobaculia bacterium]|nr:malto-oligosyltrehalose synthase [Thermoanaerobaculia bacterium]